MNHVNEQLYQKEDQPERYSSPVNLEARVEAALSKIEVDASPEVVEAVEGYYRDHYVLADTIEGALSGTLDPASIEGVLSDTEGLPVDTLRDHIDDMREYNRFASLPSVRDSLRLVALAVRSEALAPESEKVFARQDVLRAVQSALSKDLFQEQALAITTLGDTENEIIEKNYDHLIEEVQKIGLEADEKGKIHWPGDHTRVQGLSASMTKQEVLGRQEQLKEGFWDDVRFAGQLEYHNTPYLGDISSVGGIMPRTEQFRRNGSMKAVTSPGREKMHSVVPHFSESYDPYGYKSDPQAVRRGEVQQEELLTGTVAIPLEDIIKVAPFARDSQYGTVRATSEAPVNRIPIAIPTADIGAGEPDIIGRGGGDRAFFASASLSSEVAPDQFNIPLDEASTLVFYGKEIINSPIFGLGEGMPGRLHIAEGDNITEKIEELQKRMFQKYSGRIVVPLRRGVFDHHAENMHVDDVKRRMPPRYNQNPTQLNKVAA